MRRRDLFFLATGAVTAPLALRAEQRSLPLVGFLGGNSRGESLIAAFNAGLAETGLVDGHDLKI